MNDEAALSFISCIAEAEMDKTVEQLNNDPFVFFIMDESTDISGDEQKSTLVYVRSLQKGVMSERLIGTPASTCSNDLHVWLFRCLICVLYGHVETLPPFYVTSTQHSDVLTPKMRNHPSKQLARAHMYGCIELNHFSRAGSDILSG